MPRAEARRGLARYLVEVTPPPGGDPDIGELATRSRAACETVSREGIPVRLLRSVFVPEDGSCLFVFEAGAEEVVRLATERAGMPVERISGGIGARADLESTIRDARRER
jgi:hypothetical protein